MHTAKIQCATSTICKYVNCYPTVLEAGALGIAPAKTASLPAPTGDSVVPSRDPCIAWDLCFGPSGPIGALGKLLWASNHICQGQVATPEPKGKTGHKINTQPVLQSRELIVMLRLQQILTSANMSSKPQKAQQDAELMSSHCSLSSHVTKCSCTCETG